jgi:hypothetical protein
MAQILGTNTVTNGLVFALDAANNKSRSTNTFLAPKDPFAWFGLFVGNNNCTISRDDMLSPNGGKCVRMDVTGEDPYTVSYSASGANIVRAAAGETWTASCWVKGAQAGGNVEGIYLCEANAAGTYVTNSSSGSPSIGTSWTRITTTRTFTDATTVFAQIRIDGPQTGGTGQTYWWADFQLEKLSSASAFNSAINTGNATVVNMAGSNAVTSTNITFTDNYAALNGTNSYFQAGQTGNIAGDISIELWVYLNSLAGSPIVVNKGSHYALSISSSGGDSYAWADSSNYSFVNFAATGTRIAAGISSLNTWKLITATKTGSSYNIYINGVLQDSVTFGSALTAVTSDLWIGGYSDTAAAPTVNLVNGRYGSVKIYNKLLSAAEVLQNYNATKSRYGL